MTTGLPPPPQIMPLPENSLIWTTLNFIGALFQNPGKSDKFRFDF